MSRSTYTLKEISASMDPEDGDDKLWEVRERSNRYYFWQRFDGSDVKVEYTYAEIPGVINVSGTQIAPEIKEFVAEKLL